MELEFIGAGEAVICCRAETRGTGVMARFAHERFRVFVIFPVAYFAARVCIGVQREVVVTDETLIGFRSVTRPAARMTVVALVEGEPLFGTRVHASFFTFVEFR